MSLDKWVQLN